MRNTGIVAAGLVFVLLAVIQACESGRSKSLQEGESLARQYCVTCHAFPDPSLLDKKTWEENVLPEMARFMNVDLYIEPYNNSGPAGDVHVERARSQTTFPYQKWQHIVDWYLHQAPEKPVKRSRELSAIADTLTLFDVHPLDKVVEHPLTTYIGYDSALKKVVFGDGLKGAVYTLSADYRVEKLFDVPTGIADIQKVSDSWMMLSMGILKPSDQRLGTLSGMQVGKPSSPVLDSLQRPVRMNFADLDGDGIDEVIVSEFGYRNGSFGWYKKTTKGYEKHVLRGLPGAMDSRVQDFNNDGLPDIAVLMAQGDEGVFIYYNEKAGKFREERVLQFPPAYGSNFFDLVDFNKDGFMDIITTNGDNGDNSNILKPYHGIRLFLNDGANKFTEKLFLPVFGIQKVLARDFDNDGDLDLASIAFFPDYAAHANESFIFWENTGDVNFKRSTFRGVNDGRWMTMDATDIDADGDIDILLGNAFFSMGEVPVSLKEKWKQRPISVMVLKNRLHNTLGN